MRQTSVTIVAPMESVPLALRTAVNSSGCERHQLPIDHRDIGTGIPQCPDHPSSGQGHRQVAMPPRAALEGQVGGQTSGHRRVEGRRRAVEQQRVLTEDVQPQQRPRTGTAGAEPGDGAFSCSEAGHGEVREDYSLDRGAAEETLCRVLTDHGAGDHGIGVRDLRRGRSRNPARTDAVFRTPSRPHRGGRTLRTPSSGSTWRTTGTT